MLGRIMLSLDLVNGHSPMSNQGFFQQFWEKALGQNWEKMVDLTSKLGEINDIEHNMGSKIYPQIKLFYIVLCQAHHLSTSV